MKKILLLASALILSINTEAQIKREQPKSGPIPVVHVSKPKEFTLKNGLRVLVVEDHKLPRVSYSLTIDTPPTYEGEKVGLSSLTSGVVGNGTTKTPKNQFNEEIDFLGANIFIGRTGASGSGLSKYADRILELMAEGVLYPLFTQEEFDKVKAQTIEGLKTDEKSASAIASRVEDAVLYGKNHAFGEFETEASLKGITLEDVKKDYKKYSVPEKAYLIIVGDVKFDHVKKQVEKLFGKWKKASAPKSDFKKPTNVSATEINFVDVPNAVQSEISLVTTTDLKMTDKDYFSTLMANQILGGGGEGRLFLNLREAHGWTYGAYSSIGASRYSSKFRAQASVRNSVTDSAVVEFMNEIKKIREIPVTEEELNLAKAKYIGNFVMQTQKPGTIASFALQTILNKLPADYYENYIKNINAVTIQDIQNAAKKHFKADNLRIVIAGKGSEVLPGLERLGYTIKYFDKEANPTAKPESSKAVDATTTAKNVIEKHINAIGGLNKLESVKSLVSVSSATAQGTTITVIKKVTNKGQFYQSISAMGMEIMKQVVTPTSAYVNVQGQKQEITGEELKDIQKSAVIFSELNDLKNASNFKVERIENFNGEDAYVLTDGKVTNYYSVATGLKIGTSTEVEQMGQKMVLTYRISNYKEVEGIKFPFTTSDPILGDIDVNVTELKINKDVTDADFK